MKKMLKVMVLGVGMLLAACGGENTSTQENVSSPSGEANTEINLKFGMVAGTQSNEYKAAQFLADYVNEQSEGAFTIDLFPDAQLGDDRAMLDQLQDGTLDLTFSETGRFGIWVPKATILGLPYIVEDYDHLVRAIYDTDYGQNLHEELINDFNLRVVGTAYNGTRQTTANREITSVDDMNGIKLRVPEAQTLLDYASYTGASPTPMAFTEVYLALQTNAVDGQENPLSTIEATKFYEVQDYLAMTNHVVNDANYVVSESTWGTLTSEQQELLTKAIQEAVAYHTDLFETEEAELVAYFEEQGVTITHPDLDEFRDAVSEAYPKYLEEIGEGSEEYMDQIENVR
ncbi:sialic acid TRAP transporter substrate-binding protein SiaP [Alkalihalophilus marmarensis]|uniref:sialic acid TRAP transporter substrate-binding protein SiaP n=1 Tax=Alkalihalophilus marmarensis TaxID=521377 RepID=UPI00203FD16F|nr:sialic acid TRAP transporter substrate-binding protein SiaP [Alkalihalophilus marmarensis]MCM3491727.1 sialic acid TRAP transporter substrate-binding protein SiaP [Alkalihalophilus marmarensis]